MNYAIIPYADNEGLWPLDNAVLERAWSLLVAQDKVRSTFYDGSITTAEEFIEYLQKPSNYPTFMWNLTTGYPALLGWFNSLKDANCQAHFVCFDGSNPIKAGRELLEWWSSWDMIRNVIGVTPESNENAVRYIQLLGFQVMGTVPDFCDLVYENRRVGGTFAHYSLNGGSHG